jgi:putative endonuclease
LRYLSRRGYTLVERNYRTRYGELDLILRHQDILVFVEVKLRRGVGFGEPLEAVTARKQATIRALAERYLSEREPGRVEIRFDVVGILAGDGAPRITHIENAF